MHHIAFLADGGVVSALESAMPDTWEVVIRILHLPVAAGEWWWHVDNAEGAVSQAWIEANKCDHERARSGSTSGL